MNSQRIKSKKVLKAEADKERNSGKTDKAKREEARRRAINDDELKRKKRAENGYEVTVEGTEEDLEFDSNVLDHLIAKSLLDEAKTVKTGNASKWPIIGVKKQEK